MIPALVGDNRDRTADCIKFDAQAGDSLVTEVDLLAKTVQINELLLPLLLLKTEGCEALLQILQCQVLLAQVLKLRGTPVQFIESSFIGF